jgi:hypothetical protein
MNAAEVNALPSGLYKLIWKNGVEALAAVGNMNMSGSYPNRMEQHPLRWFMSSHVSMMTAAYGEAWNGIKEAILLFANEDVETAGKPRVAEPVNQDDIRQSLVDHSKRLMESHQELMGVYKQYIEDREKEDVSEKGIQENYEILKFRMHFLLHAMYCTDDRADTIIWYSNMVKKIEFGYSYTNNPNNVERHCILPLKVTSHITSHIQSSRIVPCVLGYCPTNDRAATCYVDQVYPLSYVNQDDKAKA